MVINKICNLTLNVTIMFRTSLFLGEPVQRRATSINVPEIEVDEYTDNYNSEHFKSTLFANQLDTNSTLKNAKSNKRYTIIYT